jgi:CBS domain-containing protein
MEPVPGLTKLSDPTKQAGVETVDSILRTKGRQVWSIAPTATVYEAIALMASKHVGALVVMDEARLVGIVSERDYARKVILQNRSSKQTPVSDIMSSPVSTVTPQCTVEECLRVMTMNRIRHLPVLEGDLVSGTVSIGDLVRSILSMQAHTIDQLETLITNTYPK